MAQRGTHGRNLGLRRAGRFVSFALAVTIAGTATAAMAAVRIERGAESLTPGTNNGEEGYWVEYTEYTYESLTERLREANKSLKDDEIKSLADYLLTIGQRLSDADLKDLSKDWPTKQRILAAYKQVYGSKVVVTPSELNYMAQQSAWQKRNATEQVAALQALKDHTSWNALTGIPAGRTDLWSFSVNRPFYASLIDRYAGDNWSYKDTWLKTYAKLDDDAAFTQYVKSYNSIPNTLSSFLECSRLAKLLSLLDDSGLIIPDDTITGENMAFYVRRPFTIASTKTAILAKFKEIFKLGIDTYSPIVLDLNHDGRIGVTGRSTAAVRNQQNGFVRQGSVLFDLRATGRKDRYEWLKGDGDGFLVYNRGGEVDKAVAAGEDIDGHSLFGNVIGYDHGFQKLALLTGGVTTASGKLDGVPSQVLAKAVGRTAASGKDLDKLRIWQDTNRDARVQAGELKTLGALGITEVGLQPEFKKNGQGETVIVSYFVQNGKRFMTEDVWFAIEPAGGAR